MGAINVCIEYDDSGMSEAQENALKLYHFEDGAWVDVTVPPADTANNIIFGIVDSLSPFALLVNPALRLAQDVIALDLQGGIENSLVAKLENAARKLDDGKTAAAVNMLEAFINQVDAQRGKKIPQVAADTLIDTAQEIIELVSG